MSWRGVSNRRRSPTSDMTVTAVITLMPRNACNASTTRASDHFGKSSAITASMRSRRSSACLTARSNSWSTRCWAT